MKFSFNNCDGNIKTGYGYATHKIITNIGKTNHSLLIERENPVEITFSHPQFYKFHGKNSHKIGYTAWESTELQPMWQEYISHLDEMWVPNQFCKDVFSKFTDKEIYVFPHGVDDTWAPIERKVDDKIKFLHMGHPAYRKNLPEVINTFLELYAGRKDVELTVKAYSASEFEINEPNINVVIDTVTYSELASFVGQHHALLYPSWGEGFGLMPLQALATGMPVIMTDGWCDYKDHCPELVINSKLVYNPWQLIHPGKMFRPDLNHFAALVQHTEKNIESILDVQSKRALDVHKKWKWEKVVTDHLDSVEARLMI